MFSDQQLITIVVAVVIGLICYDVMCFLSTSLLNLGELLFRLIVKEPRTVKGSLDYYRARNKFRRSKKSSYDRWARGCERWEIS